MKIINNATIEIKSLSQEELADLKKVSVESPSGEMVRVDIYHAENENSIDFLRVGKNCTVHLYATHVLNLYTDEGATIVLHTLKPVYNSRIDNLNKHGPGVVEYIHCGL